MSKTGPEPGCDPGARPYHPTTPDQLNQEGSRLAMEKSNPLAEERIKEIRERELSASEGPWLFKGTEQRDDLSLRLTIGEAPDGEEIAHIVVSAEAAGWSFHRMGAQADAEFIAHARSDIPALLAEVERLRNVIGGMTTVTGTVIEERDRLAELVSDLTDPDPCEFDHHGGCQAHGYLSLEPGEKCPHAEAKEILAKRGGSEAGR